MMSDSLTTDTMKVVQALATMASQFELNQQQQEQFGQYLSMLLKANLDFNLTTITKPLDVVEYHFKDSLFLTRYIDAATFKGLMDVGTGGGFPGIPLKIKYPELPIFLLEVTQKKINFLQQVIEALSLKDIEIVAMDWRTFLRKVELPIDLFVSRASLQPEELVRALGPSSIYKGSEVVYWASQEWQPDAALNPLVKRIEEYKVGNRVRKLVFFKK